MTRASFPAIWGAVADGIVALVPLALLGCVGYPVVEGYAPAGPGTVDAGGCGSRIADRISLPLPGGSAWRIFSMPASIYPTDYEQLSLDIALVLPEGVSARLESPSVTLHSASWEQPHALSTVQVQDTRVPSPAARLSPDAVLHGALTDESPPSISYSGSRPVRGPSRESPRPMRSSCGCRPCGSASNSFRARSCSSSGIVPARSSRTATR